MKWSTLTDEQNNSIPLHHNLLSGKQSVNIIK